MNGGVRMAVERFEERDRPVTLQCIPSSCHGGKSCAGPISLSGSRPCLAADSGQAIQQAQVHLIHLTGKSPSEVRYLYEPPASQAWKGTAF